MGEAKRRKLAKHISICDSAFDGMQRLGLSSTGTPVSITLIGAGLIAQEVYSGGKRLLAAQNSTEVHSYRLVFGIWDRIRTGEFDPWQCSLCANDYHGLPLLSVFALADDPRAPPRQDKHGVVALVCQSCDSISTSETKRLVHELFRLAPPQQEGKS